MSHDVLSIRKIRGGRLITIGQCDIPDQAGGAGNLTVTLYGDEILVAYALGTGGISLVVFSLDGPKIPRRVRVATGPGKFVQPPLSRQVSVNQGNPQNFRNPLLT